MKINNNTCWGCEEVEFIHLSLSPLPPAHEPTEGDKCGGEVARGGGVDAIGGGRGDGGKLSLKTAALV